VTIRSFFHKRLPRMAAPTILVCFTGAAYAADRVIAPRIDGAEGVGLSVATTVSIAIAVGVFIVWAMRDRQSIEARVTSGEKERTELLSGLKSAQEITDKRMRIVLARIEHERARRKAGEQVIRRIAEKVGVESHHCAQLDSDGSLAGHDSLDLLDLENA